MRVPRENDRVLLIAPDDRRYMLRLRHSGQFHTNKGILEHDELIGTPYGSRVSSHLGQSFVLLQASIHDKLMRLRRRSQIIYPKDIGLILLKLNITHGDRVIEAGTGSGALAMALAHAVQPDGMVFSYEARRDMLNGARKNLADVGLLDNVTLTQRDIADGFDQVDVDALFLDVREPWDYLPQVEQALADGGFFGCLVPTTNQVSALLEEMATRHFTTIEVLEVLVRNYKPVPQRLRPQDRMVGHTGYLIFARKVRRDPELPATQNEPSSIAEEDAPA